MHSVASQVYGWWQQRGEAEEWRQYLGTSYIGHPCERYLWLSFRWAARPKFDGRMYRLFNRGHREESTVIEELRGIGCEVSDTQPNGKQWGFSDLGGHFRGHMDGAVTKTPYAEKTWAVLEVKTFNAKTFKELQAKGVKVVKPQHYAQMQIYMEQMQLERAMYYAVCKDDDQIHTEWLHFNPDEVQPLMNRAKRVITSVEPPLRLSNDASWFECKWCDMHSICHGTAAPIAGCRTCAHATAELDGDGRWSCADNQTAVLTHNGQRQGCGSHRYIPILLEKFAEQKTVEDGRVVYRNTITGTEFVNGTDHPDYTSAEIHAAEDKKALGDPGVAEFREVFTARIAA